MQLVKKMLAIFQKKPILFIFLIAFVVRLLAVLILVKFRGVITDNDIRDYLQFADFMLEQGFWVTDVSNLTAHSGPGWPLVLAIDKLLLGTGNYWLVFLVNILLSSLSVVVFYELAKKLIKNQIIVLIASFWYLLYIPHLWYVHLMLKETLVFSLMPLSLLAILKMAKESKSFVKWLLIFVISYGYLIHSDERYLFYLPFILVGFFLMGEKTSKVRIKQSMVIAISILLILIPWTIRNYKVYDRPILLSIRTAKFTDKLIGYDGVYDKYRPAESEIYNTSSAEGKIYYTDMIDSLKQGLSIKSKRADWKLVRDVTEGLALGLEPSVRTNFQTKLHNLKILWMPFRLETAFDWHGMRLDEGWSIKSIFAYSMQYLLILPFAILGLFFGFKDKKIMFLLMIILVHTFIHAVLAWSLTRYRLPLDALILLIGFYGLDRLYQKRNDKKLIENIDSKL